MFLTVHRRRIALDPGVWISPEEIMRRALAESLWPRNKIYLEWDFGHEPIHTMEELAFASRLVQTNHCRNMEYDYGDIFSMDDDELRQLDKPRVVRRRTPPAEPPPSPALQPHPDYLPMRCPLVAARKRRQRRMEHHQRPIIKSSDGGRISPLPGIAPEPARDGPRTIEEEAPPP